MSAAALLAAVALSTASASAATQVGNVCEANNTAPASIVLVQVENESSALPVAAPAAGVVTGWRMQVAEGLTGDKDELKVLRAAEPGKYKVVAETSLEPLTAGAVNSFPARIPVQAGDLFGLYGGKTGATPYCGPAKPGDVAGVHNLDLLTTDAADLFNKNPGLRLPLSVTIEPDADGDGFGDETQDKCPQSAQFQAECPQIGLDQFASPGKGSVTDVVIADHEAPVTVTATAKLPAKGKHKARVAASIALKGATQTVVPGKLSKFTLKFTKPLKSALAGLPKGKSLTLTVRASATNLVGQASSAVTTVKLKR